jgi:cell division protein FtsZ
MERRQFLVCMGSGLGLAAAGLSLAAPDITDIQRARDPVFVGLGNGGINLVRAVSDGMGQHYSATCIICMKINRTDGLSASPLPADERHRLEHSAIFFRHKREASRVILMAGLSRATGGELVVPVARRYQEEGADVVAVVTLPFHFEGKHWRGEAERQLADIRASRIPVHVIDNAAAIDGLPSNTTLLQAYRSANSKAVAVAVREAWPDATGG